MVIRNETSMFLSPLKPEATRQRRGTALGMAALAAVGLFGSGLVMRKSDSCGLRGIFGGCHDQTKANAKNIRTISEVQDVLTVFVTDLSTNTDEKFFLVENELAALQAIQAEMSRTQNTNWAIFQEQFDIYADNFHILRDCDQLFFANQQLNFNFDISSLLAMCHASVKKLPISFVCVPHEPSKFYPSFTAGTFADVVYSYGIAFSDFGSRCFPASLSGRSTSDRLSYYDSRLLADTVTISEGLLLTLGVETNRPHI